MKIKKNETQKFYSGGFLSGVYVREGGCPRTIEDVPHCYCTPMFRYYDKTL